MRKLQGAAMDRHRRLQLENVCFCTNFEALFWIQREPKQKPSLRFKTQKHSNWRATRKCFASTTRPATATGIHNCNTKADSVGLYNAGHKKGTWQQNSPTKQTTHGRDGDPGMLKHDMPQPSIAHGTLKVICRTLEYWTNQDKF